MKKLLSSALALALTLSLAAPAWAAEETPAPWYAEAQAYVTENGIMTGTDKGFEPEGKVTRATVLQTLYNLYSRLNDTSAVEGTLTDVEGAWYADAANWAASVELVAGTAFGADAVITRAGVAQLIADYCALGHVGVKGGEAVKEAPDYAAVPEEFQQGVDYCYAAKIMTGDADGKLNPMGELSRAEFAQILQNMGGFLAENAVTFTEDSISIDVPEQDGIPAHSMPAIVTAPKAEGKYPAVVMLHGTGSEKNEAGNGYVMAAGRLAELGIVSIRIDFMGNGASEADYVNYNYTSAKLDAKAAADYVSALENVDADKIAVMGWSQGGTDALLAAAAYPETFKAVVTWSGAVALDGAALFGDKTFDEAYDIAKKDGYFEMTFDWRESLHLGEQWFQEVKDTDILKETAKISAPILAINGDKDDVVPMDNAVAIKKAAKDGQTWIVDGADHTYNVFSGDTAAIYEATFQTASFLQEKLCGTLISTIAAVEKYGNIDLDVPPQKLLDFGFAYGDVITVTAGGETLSIPFCTSYSDVDNGELVLRHNVDSDLTVIAVNMGNFAKTYGVGEGDVVALAMGEKEGYLAQFQAHQVTRTNERADYDTDEAFANFRPIVLGDIAEGVLYRTSSPVNPELGRAAYADDLIDSAGVQAVVNMADSNENIDGYIAAEGFDSPYYKGLYESGNVIALNMGVDFADPDFAAKLKEGVEFMLSHEGPYAFHCTEGKDRAGFMAVLLEALMGASKDEIVDDYMLSYENYYHVEHQSEQWKTISSIAEGNLCNIAGLEKGSDLSKIDLVKAAETYLTGTVGLTADQVSGLKTLLSTPAAAEKAA